MTRLSCPSCRLRFTPAAAARLTTCPECGRFLQVAMSAEEILGHRLFDPSDSPAALPVAAEMALPTDPDLPQRD